MKVKFSQKTKCFMDLEGCFNTKEVQTVGIVMFMKAGSLMDCHMATGGKSMKME